MTRAHLAIFFSLATLCGCPRNDHTLTVAAALLPGELAAYRDVLRDFERQSGLAVIVVPQQYADIRRALAAEAFAGSGTLDLVELDVYALASAADHVALLDEADLAHALAAMVTSAVDAGRFDGLRFLPHRLAWQALIYNHRVIEEPPATWDELLAVARAHPGRIGLKGALYEGFTCDLLTFVWEAGGSAKRLDEPQAITALRFLAQLAPYLNPQSATFKEATIAEAMARGEIVLHMNWPFVMSLFASEGLAPEPIRSAPLPRGPAGLATVLGGGYIGIPIGAPHPRDARRLARYLIGKHAQQSFAEKLGWFSARRDVPIAEEGGLLTGFNAMRSHVRSRPEETDYPQLSRAWQQAGRAILFEGARPAVTLRKAQRRLESDS